MQSTKASLRYAKAIFNLAKEQNIVDQVLLDFKNLAAIINEKTELFFLIKDPTIKYQKKIRLFEKALAQNYTKQLSSFNFGSKKSRSQYFTNIPKVYRAIIKKKA